MEVEKRPIIESNDTNKTSAKGNAAPIIVLAFAILFALSFVPWGRLTNNIIKDFDLFADLKSGTSVEVTAEEDIDPALSVAIEELDDAKDGEAIKIESPAPFNPRVNGEVVIEDYTENGQGLKNLRQALADRANRCARIAVIGDSYIEGDIFTCDLRDELQSRYGGHGVGYMNMFTDIPGFRTSVVEKCSGWDAVDLQAPAARYCPLSGEYFIAGSGAKTSYHGTSRFANTSTWNETTFLFISPKDGSVTITTDAGPAEFQIKASDRVQSIHVQGNTSKATVTTDIVGLVALGTYINDSHGIAVDCMSLRGNSGATHRNLDRELAAQMRQYMDYDLIVVEYGINALSSQQSDYTAYGKIMERVIASLRACYPDADILMMGIGDRGQKAGTEYVSVPTAQSMVDAQRAVAKKTGCLFWDTREAMGGDGAAIVWREQKMLNGDYIHLNGKGGKRLAQLFVNSLTKLLE
jgi:lysophospholipase L1-like esterase